MPSESITETQSHEEIAVTLFDPLQENSAFDTGLANQNKDNFSQGNFIQKVRQSRLIRVAAAAVAFGIAGHYYVGYEAHRAARILQDSGAPTGRDAGREAAKVFVSKVSDPKVQNQFFSNVIDNYNALPPNQRINFMQGLLAIIAESGDSTPKINKKASEINNSNDKRSALIAQATRPEKP